MLFSIISQYIHMSKVQYICGEFSAFQEILGVNGLTQYEFILANINITARYFPSSVAL